MPQCFGRILGDKIPFENEGSFYLLRQCPTITRSTLCDTCNVMETKTKAKCNGKGSMGKSHTAYLIGRVMEPIPDWAHTYGNEWFRLKIAEGSTISEENMAKAKTSLLHIAPVAPEPVAEPGPGPEPKKKVDKRKSRAPAPISAEKVLETLPTLTPEAPITRRKPVKKSEKSSVSPMGKVEGNLDISDYEILHIKVQKKEIDGRIFYLDPKKDKLYDMKFKYVGRFKEEGIVIHQDSDQDI